MERIKLGSILKYEERMGGFHRSYKRGDVSGFSCDIADGHRSYSASVENVSKNGFKVSNLRDSFDARNHHYHMVISGNGQYYKILAKPCWRRDGEKGSEMGFKILDSSWEWVELMFQLMIEDGDRIGSC